MDEVEQGWRQLQQTGDTRLIRRSPQDLQEQLICLQTHRHLVSRGVYMKGINHCFHLLPGAFTSEALQLQYLITTKASKQALEELPEWKAIFDQWIALKYAPDLQDDHFLMAVASLEGLRSPQMLVVFINCISESLAQMVVRRHVAKLAEIEQLNFKDKDSVKVAFSINNLIAFLDLLLPHVLFNTIVGRSHLPLPLAGHQQLQCMYSNCEMEFIVKQCAEFTALLRVIFGVVVVRLGEVGPMQERMLMQAAFRFYYLHQQVKGLGAVEVLISCFNAISQSVRFALTEEFLLFLHVIRRLGKEKLLTLLLDKSEWLREIDSKMASKKIVGYSLETLDPFGCCLPERIHIQRGSSAIKYLQCIDDHSLVFLRVVVEDLDITIKISLVGDHLRKEAIEFTPLMFEKVKGQVRRTLILPRRGVYCIKFDNTYSWLNAKNITYERVILTPLSYMSKQAFPYRSAYFLNTPMNSIAKNKLINIDCQISHRVRIHKREGLFIFIIQRLEKEIHHYETDSLNCFITKLHQLAASTHPYHFWFDDQRVQTVSGVQQLLRRSEVRRRDKGEIIEMISLKY